MPTADSTGWTPTPSKKPLFRDELKMVRQMVIDYKLDDASLPMMRNIIKVVAAIDGLEMALADLAYYVRHEDTRDDDREREADERQKENDRRMELDYKNLRY